ncbi:hypothetical protein S245_071863 [Arachis hypogaea]
MYAYLRYLPTLNGISTMIFLEYLMTAFPIGKSHGGALYQNDPNKIPALSHHKRGCNCKKSFCQKKYCKCFQAGVGCSINCRCDTCKNTFGRKNGIRRTTVLSAAKSKNPKATTQSFHLSLNEKKKKREANATTTYLLHLLRLYFFAFTSLNPQTLPPDFCMFKTSYPATSYQPVLICGGSQCFQSVRHTSVAW